MRNNPFTPHLKQPPIQIKMETESLSMFNRKMAALVNSLTSSIAFYPIIITLFYLALVIGMLEFDYSEAAKELREELPWLGFKEMETVRVILTTLIAGIISLMALSFSMVMVVLNQATNTVSPKVMQGLITRKEHQFVLGNQFGAILYFMVLLLLLRGLDFFKIPVFSVTIGLLLGFWSLSLFVYFIHSISQSIQITNIIRNIHDVTLKNLRHLQKTTATNGTGTAMAAAVFETPYAYKTDKPGYLQQINHKSLMRMVSKYDMQIRIEPCFTDFVSTGSTLFWSNLPAEKLPPKDLQLLYDSIIFINTENVGINHLYGFTQLSEVAVKALSPGINDPGIAVVCVQYLTDLFVNFYPVEEQLVVADATGKTRLELKKIGFEALFNLTIRPIRQYGKRDVSVVRALLQLLLILGQTDCRKKKYQKLLNQHGRALISEIESELIVPADAEVLNSLISKMLTLEPPYFELPLAGLKR